FSPRPLPRGSSFGHKGPLVTGDAGLAVLALMASQPFIALIGLQLAAAAAAARSYEVGLVQRIPVPDLNESTMGALASRANNAWAVKRALDSAVQASHAFT